MVVVVEEFKEVDVVGADDDVATDTNDGALTESGFGECE